MSIRYEVAACPLCRAEFEDPEDYRAHLADEHDLVDDEGTETVLPKAAPVLPVLETAPSAEVLEPLPPVTPPPPPPEAPVPAAPVATIVAKAPLPLAALAIAVAVQLLLGVLGLAVVGRDDDEVARSTVITEPSPTTAAATPTTVADPAADQRRADAIALRPSDLPAGWSLDSDGAGSDSESEGNDEFDQEFDECASSIEGAGTDTTAEKEVTLSDGDNSVFGFVGLDQTSDAAVKSMDALGAALPCMAQAMTAGIKSELPRGVTVTNGPFTPAAVGKFGDQSDAQTMAITISGPGGKVGMRIDVFAVRKDRAIVFILAAVLNDGLTLAHERTMLASIASRM